MKGCLSLIIKIIIGVLVFFGLLHLGVIDYIREKIDEKTHTTQEQLVDNTKDIVDLSDINDEYEIAKDLKILKNRMIVAEHEASGQKMVMIEPQKENILTKKDIEDDAVQEKINKALSSFKHLPVKFDKVEVLKHGEFEGIGQTIPYVKVDLKVSNLPIKDMEGIVGVAELKNGKNLIVISAGEKGKYSQIITNAFYEKVK